MIIDVDSPLRNIVLNACFYSILLAALASLLPWRAMGAAGLSRAARWLVVVVPALALVYEVAMPASFDIRVDLFLLLPLYLLVAATSVARWIGWRRRDQRTQGTT